MEQLKTFWKKLDGINRIVLVTGLAAAIVCLVMGQWKYSIVFMVFMGMFMVAHNGQRIKRLSRLYGALYFHMPDGELYPMTFEQVRAEYVKGAHGRYGGRKVSIWFPYWRIRDGILETGFNLDIDLTGFEDPEGILPTLKSGQYILVTGELQARRRDYFCIGAVEEVRRQAKRPEVQ